MVRTAAPGAEFRAEGLAVDCPPEENICLKAFRLMQRHYGVDGVAIRLGKRVPFGAGLGGDRQTARRCCWLSTSCLHWGCPKRS